MLLIVMTHYIFLSFIEKSLNHMVCKIIYLFFWFVFCMLIPRIYVSIDYITFSYVYTVFTFSFLTVDRKTEGQGFSSKLVRVMNDEQS